MYDIPITPAMLQKTGAPAWFPANHLFIPAVQILPPGSKMVGSHEMRAQNQRKNNLATWNHNPDPWKQDLGAWKKDFGTWKKDLGAWKKDLGAWKNHPGPWKRVPGFWEKARGVDIHLPEKTEASLVKGLKHLRHGKKDHNSER